MTDFTSIFQEAKAAALAAVAAHAHEEGRYGLDCGFAWVDVRYGREASITKQFRNWSKKSGLGRASHQSGVWTFWNPGQHRGQSIHVIEAGAAAFAQVLQKHGITAYVGSRLD